tara:strand:- start:27 stop:272 length:246 start_codon:yes stop_codon:yes gene_type:complete
MDNFFVPNEAEFGIIAEIAASDSDRSVVMMNLNTYFEQAGYPDEQPCSDWIKVLDVLIKQAGVISCGTFFRSWANTYSRFR